MIEYESLGHMMPVENNEKSMDPKIYFLPHHAVMKGDSVSTKLRVVFDGTCKTFKWKFFNSILGIATRRLFQTGLDLERDDPAVSSLIKESFYIDDLMAGALRGGSNFLDKNTF
ncbi:hypothetical protein TNCV_4863831 [Trichonephila clavipes]|nr:hypothetical protein TNCV_4863831 [Trichonephila clavipes]